MSVTAARKMEIPSIRILGVRVDRVDMKQTLEAAKQFVESGQPHQIVVVNVAKIIKARSDNALREVIEGADLVGADGVPVVWASRLLGPAIPGRVNGTDLMEELVELSDQNGYRVYFLGAKQEVVERVVETYKMKYANLNVAGYRNGYYSEEDEEQVALSIRDASADILLIALGTPQKEHFANRYGEVMNVPVIHGVGGSFDVVAGLTKRAPLWMQRAGLEWIYRLCQEPRRMWRRYLITNTVFVGLMVFELLRGIGRRREHVTQ